MGIEYRGPSTKETNCVYDGIDLSSLYFLALDMGYFRGVHYFAKSAGDGTLWHSNLVIAKAQLAN